MHDNNCGGGLKTSANVSPTNREDVISMPCTTEEKGKSSLSVLIIGMCLDSISDGVTIGASSYSNISH